MLSDDNKCLAIAANMTTVIKLTQLCYNDGVINIDRKKMTFLKIIREKGKFRVMQICISLLWNVQNIFNSCTSMIVFIWDYDLLSFTLNWTMTLSPTVNMGHMLF